MTNEQFNNVYDVFHSYLVADADYAGCIELPTFKASKLLPKNVITFSKAMNKSCKDFDGWVVFYEHDRSFERLWNQPKRYLNKLKKFCGIISPDFSLYRNMPLVMQAWNTYRGRALAHWMQSNGIEVIPNIRWGDERTFDFCFDGIETNSNVAVGTHGCIKRAADKQYFKKGLKELIKQIKPKNIVVYRAAPDEIFGEYRENGINIIQFDSEFAKSRKQVTA